MKQHRVSLVSWIARVIAFATIGTACIDATTVYTVPNMQPGGDDGGGGASEAGDGGAESDASPDGVGAAGDGGGTSEEAADGRAND